MNDSGAVRFMDDAGRLALASLGTGTGGPFGAVIVRNGVVIGSGKNESFSLTDPTAHAEIQAIRDACSRLGSLELAGAVIYCSAEPCPMCMSAIYWAMLDGVYFANTKEESAACGFDDARIYDELRHEWNARKMNMVHLPNETAQEAFRDWERRKSAGEFR